jgi:cytochrome c oxidase subunit 2
LLRADWFVFIAAGIAVGAIVYACIFYALLRWNRRASTQASQFNGNTPLEIGGVVTSVIIVIALFVVTMRYETKVDALETHPATIVKVTAFRWSWQFEYAGTPIRVSGTPEKPPVLYLPVGRTTEIDVGATDVDHSFWVPATLFKRDAIPGMTNKFDVRPLTLGSYDGHCAELCGIGHAVMTFTVSVVPAAKFDRYLASGGRISP